MSILHMPKSATDTICESFIYQGGGALIVIDGGFESESESLKEYIIKLGGHVDAWFFTHPHDDHFGAFCGIMAAQEPGITVDRLYYNFSPDETIAANEPISAEATRKYLPMIRRIASEHGIGITTMRKGDSYSIGDCTVNVLREPDDSIVENFINNSSTVFRLDTNGKRIMFLGDLGVEGGIQLMETVPPEELASDYVQMAHHGQNGVDRDVYEAIAPSVCLWNTPTWLWDNIGNDGYDSGQFKTIIVRGWMSEIGVRKHYINSNGPYEITF